MSSRYWELLWKRAKRFLVRAERDYNEGDYDGACFNSVQAVELATKAVIYRLFGVRVEAQGVKDLLVQLRRMFYNASEHDLVKLVDEVINGCSNELELLEKIYIDGMDIELELSENQGKTCLKATKKILETLIRIEYSFTQSK